MQSLLAGETSVSIVSPLVALPYVKAGQMRALAVLAPKRTTTLPEVPTMEEIGFSDIDMLNYVGLFAPSGTPEEALHRLRDALSDIIKEDEIKKTIVEAGADIVDSDVDAAKFDEIMVADRSRWTEIIKTAGLKQ
jgi:tripartite-type tricarboxylate transporter receptor subunit TctC